jgi:hypothetical protein
MDSDPMLQAECLVAMVGVEHALKPRPKPPSLADISRTAKLPETIRKRVRALLDRAKPTGKIDPPELPDFMATSESLAEGPDHDALVEAVVDLPPKLQAGAAMVWMRAAAYLNSIFPRNVEMRLTGPKLHEPSAGKWGEFGWAWRLANAPMFAFDFLEAGGLLTVEVAHLKAMFPELYATICGAIQDGLADKIADDPEWMVPWWLQKQLCVMLGISPVSPTLLADIEQAVQKSQQEAKPKASTGKLDMKNETSTTSQKLAEK